MSSILDWIGRKVEDLVALGYPESVAKRISSGELPMDEASRMARAAEQGYDVDNVFYKGSRSGQEYTNNDRASWASSHPYVASSYGMTMKDGNPVGAVYPVYTKNPEVSYDVGGNLWSNLNGIEVTPDTYSKQISTDNIFDQNYKQGIKSTEFKNVIDPGIGNYYLNKYFPEAAESNLANPATSRAFSGGDVKSVNAAFDPEYKGPNIMGALSGLTAGGLGLGAALQSEDAEAGWVKNAGGIFTPDDARIATRFPTAKTAQENPILNNLIIDVDSMLASGDKQVARNAELLRGYNTPISSRRPDRVFNDFRDRVSDNLLWMFDQIPEEVRDQSKLWYDGANKLANQFAAEYQVAPNSVAGVMAALSPQKDWYMNVSLAERLIDIVKTKKDFGVTDDMKNTFSRIYGDEKYAKDLKEVVSKPWEELTDTQKAMYVRGFDETYNNRAHRIVSADGQFMDFAKTAKGEDKKTGWGSNTEIAKAISVLENPTQENISKQMGGMHKVRNFYNNIIDPNAKFGDVTIDTHAVAAGLVEPFSGKSIPVAHNFGTGAASSASTGAKGTYGVYADAYRQAAEQAGVLPREMQSITWEGVRGLFPAGFKTEKNVKAVNDVMALQKAGKISLEEARNRIMDMAGGIDNPSWYKEGRDIRDIQSTAGSSYKDASIKGGAAGSAILAALANNSFAGTDVPDSALPMAAQAAGQSDLTGVANPGRDFGNVAFGIDMLLPLFMESIKPATMGNAELTEEQRKRGYYYGM